MANIIRREQDWPSDREQLPQCDAKDSPVKESQFSSTKKLPLIRASKSVSPLPKRKLAVAHSATVKVKGERTDSHDLPPLPGYKSAEKNSLEATRSLSIPSSPSLSRKTTGGDSSDLIIEAKEGRRRNASLQSLSPGNRINVQLSPLQRRKFFSTVEQNVSIDTARGAKHTKSISLEDVNLDGKKVDGVHLHRGSSPLLWDENGLWSKHWYYTRKSIGARPEEKDFVDLETLSDMFNQRARIIKSNDFTGDVAMYGSQEPDIMNNEKSVGNSRSLEERLASIEKQQGLSTL